MYLVFVSIYKNKEVLKKHNKILGGIKNKIKTINDNKKMIMEKIT